MGDFDYRRGPVGHCTCGTAATFDEARADFEAAWRVFLSKRTEVDFQEWRDQRDWTARKYAHVGSRRRVAVAGGNFSSSLPDRSASSSGSDKPPSGCRAEG
jgi:hypothetical protein